MKPIRHLTATATALLAVSLLPLNVDAHCDAWDGPVIQEAQQALQDGNVDPTLKWVPREAEDEIKAAFKRTLAVSEAGEEARELAELWFLETLVRIHREGEGASYRGLQPAGQIDTAVELADRALVKGSADELAERISQAVARQILTRFDNAAEHRLSSAESTEAGREFVEAYVDYVHFVEEIHHLLQHGGHGH